MAMRLNGKVAIVTGGASGIGESTVRLFIEQGAKVVIADIQDERGQSIAQELQRQARGEDIVTYVHCDVTNESDVENAVEVAVSKYGKLDIMFNNAGTSSTSDNTILGANYDSFKRVFDVNVYGAFLGGKHAAKVMIQAKSGVILFTSSVASATAHGNLHAYTASKHAVVGLTKNLCVELGKYGIRVNCISPYAIATPLLESSTGMDKRSAERFAGASGNLKGAVPAVEDIAAAALYLGSDESKYVSGLNLIVDGGYSTTNQASTALLND